MVEFLNENWAALSAARWTFATLVVLSFSAAFGACKLVYSTRLSNLKSELESAKRRIASQPSDLFQRAARTEIERFLTEANTISAHYSDMPADRIESWHNGVAKFLSERFSDDIAKTFATAGGSDLNIARDHRFSMNFQRILGAKTSYLSEIVRDLSYR
ncbi:hypothetical protein XI09_16865 [Bradyrhizobium sp. CCBAU 11386]|uniref:hypothetical protein n=1 Tax=Bradyrhizobium sp. CCBAU 11386 TaxID=1630837 RepID=UPI0023033140|nr:hypothetical protein [Bradyrhizobium sp. CCBAU 11386]MDA9506275.1 hypothetical protein [Bradyrhizobium sp. CCBAU 11386]